MVTTSTFLAFQSPFICSSKKLSCFNSCTSSYVSPRLRTNQRSPLSYPSIQAELDQNSVVAISVAVVSVAIGIGIPVFYETRIDNAAKRENTQPCFPCNALVLVRLTNSVIASLFLPVCFELLIFERSTKDVLPFTEKCRFCTGSGSVTVELGGDEKDVSRCINCDGLGSLTCTTCQVSGIQPRYLDRREFKDDD